MIVLRNFAAEMKRLYIILLSILPVICASAQRVLTLDECQQMAVQGNKKMAVAKVKGDISANMHKSASTLSLPRVSAVLGYQHFGREISLLNNSQKNMLTNLGTNATSGLTESVSDAMAMLIQKGIISPEQAQELGKELGQNMQGVTEGLNSVGSSVKDALRTDTRNIYAGSVLVTQPIYMGGAINTAKEMSAIAEQISEVTQEQTRQNTVYDVSKTYWLVVQLAHKKKLADEFVALVGKLNSDVQKCIDEGVATKADGLKVGVALNEAEMTQLQVEDGIKLAKMLLCQQCGLPLDSDIALEDEKSDDLSGKVVTAVAETANGTDDFTNRPELQLLSHAADLAHESQKLIKATNRPQVLATGGILVSNPTGYHGFEKKFGIDWSVGIMARIPIWDWNANKYKVEAAKAATNIAELELDEATELIELQVEQNKFKIAEAQRKLGVSKKNIEKANENLRCANLGFSEGVMTSTEVMAAQTAWLQAETQRIDAEIELILAQLNLKKNLGRM